MKPTTRRALATAALALAGCARTAPPLLGTVAYAERSLATAPLLEAVRFGLYASPAARVTLILRDSAAGVAAMVTDGSAAAGVLPLPSFVQAVAAGAPLVVAGALTRRLSCQLVLSTRAALPPPLPGVIIGGAWRGVRVGVEAGDAGTEAFARAIHLLTGSAGSPPERALLAPDPVAVEPRWVAHLTGEALVAALADNRIDAFFGGSLSAAQVMTLGVGSVATNFADARPLDGSYNEEMSDVASAFCTVLVCHRDAVEGARAPAKLLAPLVPACTRAGQALSGPAGAETIARALPERDALHLQLALRLTAPAPEPSSYALDGRLPAGAIERYLALSAMAGRPLAGVNAGALTTTRFSG